MSSAETESSLGGASEGVTDGPDGAGLETGENDETKLEMGDGEADGCGADASGALERHTETSTAPIRITAAMPIIQLLNLERFIEITFLCSNGPIL